MTKLCKLSYKIKYENSKPVFSVAFPVDITVTVGNGTVCLNHDDYSGFGIINSQHRQAYDKYPWEYIENRNAPGVKAGRRKFLPTCFDANGKIEGFQDAK